MDDNCLPTAQELEAYQKIEPKIVDFLIEASKKEQAHRHRTEDEKLRLIRKSEGRVERMNWWGMFFAFLCVAFFVLLAAYALYLDHPWFSGFFSITALVTLVSIFVNGGNEKK